MNIGIRRKTMNMLVVTSAVLLCCSFGFTVAANYKSRLCFTGSEADVGNITLECPSGQVISIDEALFGRNKWGACVISEEDCVEKTKVFHECENLNNCTRSFKTYSMRCGYATTVFINYNCLQVDPVSTYTSTSTSTSTTKKAENHVGPQIHVSEKTSDLISGNKGDGLNETGLIAGCVVAAVITVIALVIAITMVIRHLLQKNNPGDEDDDDSLQSKGSNCCICINCASWLTSLSAHQEQHKLKATKKISSPSISRPSKTEASFKNEMAPACKGKSSTSAEKLESGDLCPMSEAGCEKVNLSTQVLTALDSNTNIEKKPEDIGKLDSNSNSGITSINVLREAYCNDGMENSPKGTSVLHENNRTDWKGDAVYYSSVNKSVHDNISQSEDIHEKNVNLSHNRKSHFPADYHNEKRTRNENQPATVKEPKYTAVSIPNTERGTVC